MKITIGHLFYDLLNLYGESGNVLALKQCLEEQGVDVELKNLSINDEWNLTNIDFLYIGAGTRNNLEIALETLHKYKKEIKDFIERDKYFLATGNSVDLFGEYILDNNNKNEMLGLFDYYTERTGKRRVSECVFEFLQNELVVLGFENNDGKFVNSMAPVFKVIKGYGTENEKDRGVEGFKYNNFYTTYLIGPILARNPKLLFTLCKDIILSKDDTFQLKESDLEIENEAYNKYLKRYDNK